MSCQRVIPPHSPDCKGKVAPVLGQEDHLTMVFWKGVVGLLLISGPESPVALLGLGGARAGCVYTCASLPKSEWSPSEGWAALPGAWPVGPSL